MAATSPLGSQPLMAFVATTDHTRARTFYRDILGLHLVAEELPFALVFDAHGTVLRVAIVRELVPAKYTVLGWRVSDIASTVGKLSQVGVRFERYAGMNQDEQGIWASPSGARVAWFLDPDGNTLSLAQF
ncbi:MAG TPA: VOC family protein [Bryobacteraceae bacterium]|nr:VOC family protein [Bryobacteraceae bacterium]